MVPHERSVILLSVSLLLACHDGGPAGMSSSRSADSDDTSSDTSTGDDASAGDDRDASAQPDAAAPETSSEASVSKAPPQPPPGQRVHVSAGVSGSIQNPSFSPNSGRLLFTAFSSGYNSGNSTLSIVSLNDGTTTPLITSSAQNVNLPGCWNPGKDLIAYSSDQGGGLDQGYLVPSQGGASTLVPTPSMRAWEPSTSPDGQWVVFEAHDAGGNDPGSIWKVRTDGTQATRLTPNGVDAKEPNWSPAGDRILYQAVVSGANDVFTMDTNGGSVFDVTNSPSDDTDASWSPDGTRIVYSSDASGDSIASLWVIPAAGGMPVRVTTGPQYDGAPSWSPDGTLIAFESSPNDPDGSSGTNIYYVAAPP